MSSAPQIVQNRQKRRIKASRNPAGRIGLAIAFLFTLFLAILLITIPVSYANLLRDLPSLATIPQLLEPPNGLLLHPTLIFDRTGTTILQTVQNPAVEERGYLPISPETNPESDEFIAREIMDATIAIIDPTFWENPGISLESLTNDQSTTVAQRLVSDLLLPNEKPGLQRSFREQILSWQLINEFGHDKVLEWYLNSAYYGNLAYGIDAASQIYFDKPASEINLAEAALLTAVAEAPTLNPIDAPEEAIKRQKIVLEAMVAQGFVSPEEAIETAAIQLEFRDPVIPETNPAQAYLNLVWEQLAPYYNLEQIERGGFEIITSLDHELQMQVNCTREVLLSRLENQPNQQGSPPEECPTARLLPTLAIDQTSLPADLTAAVVVLDPTSGQILALVGDPTKGIDPAHLPGRAPGSMLTPMLYLTAFTRGFSPANLLWDVPIEIPEVILPEVSEHQGPVRLRLALANDYLIPAIQMMSQIGADNVWRTTQELGLTSFARFAGESTPSNCRGCSLLFSGGEVTLLELTHAYIPFANQGLMVGQPIGEGETNTLPPLQPITVLEVSDIRGTSWLDEPITERRPVITQQLAYLITHILGDEVARWPSFGHPNALEIGRPVAAKVGGTSNHLDTWTIGYTPQIMVGIWVGNADSTSDSEAVVPSNISATLWNAILQYATQDFPPISWDVPPGISNVDVCDPSGQLPTRNCPIVVSEVFLTGNEPTQFDTLYQAYQVNRETGLLATVFTPPELIEERIYMQIPPIADQWAQDNQIPLPPESYDVIAMPPINDEAKISNPVMFSNVSGEIDIIGTASGNDFISYRLQAGQGLNPREWFQITSDSTNPVRDGLLTKWDTNELNGLFALQMIVLRENRKVDTTTIQVTVDNQAPDVFITYPEENQILNFEFAKDITFRVEATDNIGLDSVVFYINDEALIRQSQPPFALPWRVRSGEHILRVEAIDLAGNTRETSVNFSVIE